MSFCTGGHDKTYILHKCLDYFFGYYTNSINFVPVTHLNHHKFIN